MRKSKQRLIGGQVFSGSDPIPNNILTSLVTNGLGPAAKPTLTSFGWNGKVIGGIALWLGSDNSSVSRGSFFLMGDLLESPYVVPAKKIWPDAAEYISLSLPLSTAEMFSFPNSLASDYIEDIALAHSFQFNDARIATPPSEEDLEKANLGDFCLRAFAYPSTTNWIRVYILIFPCSIEDLRSHALYSNPKWPGILIYDCQIPLFPLTASKKIKYGCPLFPLLIPSSPSLPVNENLSTKDLSSKIASIMRTGVLPESVRTGDHLLTRWLSLDEEGARGLDATPPPTLWPAPRSSSPPPQGKSSCPPPFFLRPLSLFYLVPPRTGVYRGFLLPIGSPSPPFFPSSSLVFFLGVSFSFFLVPLMLIS